MFFCVCKQCIGISGFDEKKNKVCFLIYSVLLIRKGFFFCRARRKVPAAVQIESFWTVTNPHHMSPE